VKAGGGNAKGKAGEREAAAVLREVLGAPAARGQQYRGGSGSPDVVGCPGLHLEVKRVERLNLEAAIAQAARDASSGGNVPVVLSRRNRGEWLATVRLVDLPRLAAAVAAAIGPAKEGVRQYQQSRYDRYELERAPSTAAEAARRAVDEVRRLMSLSTAPEAETLEAFDEALGAEIEGWQMRLDELEREEGEP